MVGGLRNLKGVAKHPSTAHFPGTGPVGRTCMGCRYYTQFKDGDGAGYCFKFKELMGLKRVKRSDMIPGSTSACKYYEVKHGQGT